MAAITSSKPDKSFIAALGPLKIEVVTVSATVTTGDTYASKLASPTFALGFLAGSTSVGACAVSGRVVTVNTTLAGTATDPVVLLVFGDSLIG